MAHQPDIAADELAPSLQPAAGPDGRDVDAAAKPAERPPFDPAECFATLSRLPGVVIYQRVVKPDGDIRYTYISEGARDLFGVSPEEIISNPNALFSTHGADYRAKFRERLLSASKSLTPWDVEATLVTRDGHKKYTHAIAKPALQPDSSVLWTGVILDETRTREAVVESLSQGFLLYDPEDRLIFGNSRYFQLYPALAQVAVPGALYSDVVLGEFSSLFRIPAEHLEHSPDYRSRIERHREPHNLFEQQLSSDRWLLVDEHRTSDGSTVVLYSDISELKQRENQIRHLAQHDPLTGLPNRTLFQERLTQSLEVARNRGSCVVVMYVDIDHFKNINEAVGDLGGDAVLRCMADRLSSCLGERDTLARLGGDEFGAIIVDLGPGDTVTMVACRLLEAAAQPFEFQGQQVPVGVSIGIANSLTDGGDADQLRKKAYLALYRAKVDGRGTFRFFQLEMDSVAKARRGLELDLRQAVVKQQLELHYQPQISLKSNEVVSFEALARWRHPERGLVPAPQFISLAEETGIIVGLGEWILRQACSDALSWPETMRVSVNFSLAQFKTRDLTHMVWRVLDETRLSAHRLEIEITESLLLGDAERTLSTLRGLKNLGVSICMDDFGTGYSSLSSLRSFPFDKIKIDRSFVQDIKQSSDAVPIVQAILSLGQSLGMTTCAEGVETAEQLKYLRNKGCDQVQGYFYSEAKPASEIARLIKECALKSGS